MRVRERLCVENNRFLYDRALSLSTRGWLVGLCGQSDLKNLERFKRGSTVNCSSLSNCIITFQSIGRTCHMSVSCAHVFLVPCRHEINTNADSSFFT